MAATAGIIDELRRRGLTVATAESCTGGMLAAALTDVPGASDVFGWGLVTYSNEAKAQLLGVSRDTLDESPMAYKPMESILKQLAPTVEVVEQIRPVYNFKAGKE